MCFFLFAADDDADAADVVVILPTHATRDI